MLILSCCLLSSPITQASSASLLERFRATCIGSVAPSRFSSSSSSFNRCLVTRACVLALLILGFSLSFTDGLTISSSSPPPPPILSSFDSIVSPQVFSFLPVSFYSSSFLPSYSLSSSFSSFAYPPHRKIFLSIPSFISSSYSSWGGHSPLFSSSSFSRGNRQVLPHSEGEIKRERPRFCGALQLRNFDTRRDSSSSSFLPPRSAFLTPFFPQRVDGSSSSPSSREPKSFTSSRGNRPGVHTHGGLTRRFSYHPTSACYKTNLPFSSYPPLCLSSSSSSSSSPSSHLPQISSSSSFFPRNLLLGNPPLSISTLPSCSSQNLHRLKALPSPLSSSLSSSSSPLLPSSKSLSSSFDRRGSPCRVLSASCLPFSSSLFTRDFLFSPSLCKPPTPVHALYRRILLLKFLQQQREGLRGSPLLQNICTLTSVFLGGFLLWKGLQWLSYFFAKQDRLVVMYETPLLLLLLLSSLT
ncbi:transmembrane [Cystoisospora suis]|uniref:Transmembrane n=1 Tax=Cystoisospora suis TaxID=483139 RepID=A0A2C6KEQ4_9APIC|nr:transmembrane [Cystoisospora suis]